MIVQGMLEVLVLSVVVEVIIESGVIDSVYVDMVISVGEGFPEKGIILLDVDSMGKVEVFQLIARLENGQGLSDSINGGICGMEPRESKDNVLVATAHDIEEMFLGDLFDVHVKSTSEADCTSFVHGLVNVTIAPILFFRLIFSFLAITHPSHIISPLTTLVFIIASFHPLPRTSMTHSHLLVCTSS